MIDAKKYLEMDEMQRLEHCRKQYRYEIAERLYYLDPYIANDNEETPETIAENLPLNYLDVINGLIDRIEELQEEM